MTAELVERIVDREWTMFDAVSGVGGRASCQNDPGTFRIMRASQFMTWPEAVLESYLGDLEAAERAGRNLAEETGDNMARAYGYASMRDAEEKRAR